MSNALQLGPLLLPFELLLVLVCAAAGIVVGNRIARKAGAGVEAERALWLTLLVGVVAARLAFVFEYRSLYFAAPLTMFDIRDGGWNAGVGLAGAWLYALHRQRQQAALAKPLRWGLGAGTALFVIGSALLMLRQDTGQKMPDLAFTSLDGRTVQLNAFAGKPTVINLWATWCPPCVREMPVLRQAQAERQDIRFIFLNQGEDAARVRTWLEKQRLALENVLIDEPRRASAAFKQQGYPTTLFFDAQGRLVSRRIGELSAATLNEKLELIAK